MRPALALLVGSIALLAASAADAAPRVCAVNVDPLVTDAAAVVDDARDSLADDPDLRLGPTVGIDDGSTLRDAARVATTRPAVDDDTIALRLLPGRRVLVVDHAAAVAVGRLAASEDATFNAKLLVATPRRAAEKARQPATVVVLLEPTVADVAAFGDDVDDRIAGELIERAGVRVVDAAQLRYARPVPPLDAAPWPTGPTWVVAPALTIGKAASIRAGRPRLVPAKPAIGASTLRLRVGPAGASPRVQSVSAATDAALLTAAGTLARLLSIASPSVRPRGRPMRNRPTRNRPTRGRSRTTIASTPPPRRWSSRSPPAPPTSRCVATRCGSTCTRTASSAARPAGRARG